MDTLDAFRYKSGELLVLDQLKLPSKNEYIKVNSIKEGWNIINKMQVSSYLQSQIDFKCIRKIDITNFHSGRNIQIVDTILKHPFKQSWFKGLHTSIFK